MGYGFQSLGKGTMTVALQCMLWAEGSKSRELNHTLKAVVHGELII